MIRTRICSIVALFLTIATPFAHAQDEPTYLSDTRQLTFEGLRAGEGYFNADGTKLLFQSERMDDNPWYQIYLLDLEMGDINRVSPGHGKTSCAWIHPDNKRVLFASTHGDPQSRKLQQDELDFRASGQERRYSWDYDEHYEIYESDIKGSYFKNLTNARGYNAEGSYSPDGKLIAFASNRPAYEEPMSEEDSDAFDLDPAYMTEIYVMNADGSNVKRLTHSPGYDGGPFFSPDGTRITWRRFAPNGATAEIYTMNIDGSDQKRLTHVKAMSWAPYYHPSGDYLIFTNNSLGFANFELFIVDAQGKKDPVRVTFTDGFDGLPVFTPDGTKLAWTTNRTTAKQSQLFMASWNDKAAREALGLNNADDAKYTDAPDPNLSTAAISVDDIRGHIEFLASDQLEGRGTGTPGELKATAYVADTFKALGLEPAGDNGTYFQEFEFTAGLNTGPNSALNVRNGLAAEKSELNIDWRPIAFSDVGDIKRSKVVFAGYGIQAPEKTGVQDEEDIPEYDSFVHLDVTDKWVMVLRYMPNEIDVTTRQHFNTHSSLRYKAMKLRDLGAKGMIVVSGPNSKVKNDLVRMGTDGSIAGISLYTISITDELAQRMLEPGGKNLAELQTFLDTGEISMGFELENILIGGTIDILQTKATGRNVVARLNAGDSPGNQIMVVGAHLDHLGVGRNQSSLAHDDEVDAIHHGADDNASGVSGVLEIAQFLTHQKANGLELKRDVIFAAWSGEEINLLGSNHFTSTYPGKNASDDLYPEVSSYLNMDMIGRLDQELVIQGIGSSSLWTREIERRNAPIGLSITPVEEANLPTDTTPFYQRGVPVLNAFTGAHEDYHSPRDTADKINYEGTTQIVKLMGLIARSLVMNDDIPDYQVVKRPENIERRANLHAYLGTIPDYATDIKGLKLSGVTKGAPAEDAGLKTGDIITELGGAKIENIYDYTFAIEALKIGETITVKVLRDGETIELELTPGSRD
ncbi:MAG: M28 family peptidase [Candidatus Hydrogenedentota bacterium]